MRHPLIYVVDNVWLPLSTLTLVIDTVDRLRGRYDTDTAMMITRHYNVAVGYRHFNMYN